MAFILEPTIGRTFLERVRRSAGRVAWRYRVANEAHGPKGSWREVTFEGFRQECEQLALGLRKLGIAKGDRVAILSRTRYEWSLADLGAIAAGAVVVPVYPSLTAAEAVHLLAHSGAKAVFVEDETQLAKILPALPELPELSAIVAIAPVSTLPGKATTLLDLLRIGEAERRESPNFFEESLLSLRADDLFTICYTSGTTGVPKGAMLSHSNLMSVLSDAAETLGPHVREERETLLAILPYSHILGRVESMATFVFGWTIAFPDSVEKVPEHLREVRPTILFAVPRLFEKALGEIDLRVAKSSPLVRGAYRAALGIGDRYFSRLRRGRRPGAIRSAGYALFRETVLQKVLEGFGGRLRFVVCGGAPLPRDVGETFEVLGILILEGYGLTETCAPVTLNTPEKHKFGTVGRPLPDVTVRIADDGEILLRSKKIFAGYWKEPAETADAFDPEGWFRTGDIGFLDPQGFLHITDRKKDLIITSSGKNVAPQKIESRAKALSPMIADFVVVGDRRKHLSALVTLDRQALRAFAKREMILYSSPEELARHSKVEAEIARLVEMLNRDLARFETVKRFAILPGLFTVDQGELTPSLKVKRAVVDRKYRELIDSMYAAPDAPDAGLGA
jgi:long-chain acyl-CoA synthetase